MEAKTRWRRRSGAYRGSVVVAAHHQGAGKITPSGAFGQVTYSIAGTAAHLPDDRARDPGSEACQGQGSITDSPGIFNADLHYSAGSQKQA